MAREMGLVTAGWLQDGMHSVDRVIDVFVSSEEFALIVFFRLSYHSLRHW